MTPWNKGVDVAIQCKECKVLFLAKPYQINKSNPTLNKKYCSKKCSNKGHVLKREFYQDNYRKGIGRLGFPGSELRKKAAEKMRGEKHFKWVKDRTKLKDDSKERGGQLHREWSKQVKNRDNWICKINNSDCTGKIESHHILGWAKHPELRYDINNGITLCIFHHPRKREEEIKLSSYFKEILNRG